ncbi:MAG: hypothetical protein NTV01_20785 [Bacteroidia bacterium]|nr:hypothetical protein [Bacteroidia bacterium]
MKETRDSVSIRIFLILLVVLSGCMKENECPKLSREYFPNRIGNWWVYDRFDSLAMEKTILKVEIKRDSVWKDGLTYKMWVFNKSNLYDTLYVRTTIDSVLFYRYLEGSPQEVMLMPLSVGQSWVHPVWVRDSTRVLSKDTVEVENETFSNAYRIRRRLFAFNDYMTDDRWFVPYLGIVKLENWHYLFGWISKENWLLKEYGFGK